MIQVPMPDVTFRTASGAKTAIPFPDGLARFLGPIDDLVFLETHGVPSGSSIDRAILAKDLVAAIATASLDDDVVMLRFWRYAVRRHPRIYCKIRHPQCRIGG